MSSVGTLKVSIRLARRGDLPRIVDIYNESVLAKFRTADTEPLRVADRQRWFDEHAPEQHPIFVAEIASEVVGWCSLSAYRNGRQALRSTAEISYYVAEAVHRRGIATALLRHAIGNCPPLRLKTLIAIVLECNVASLELLEKQGFSRWGLLPNVAEFDGVEISHVYLGKKL
jgi:phosphinothricin acetyltransferase